MSSMLLDIREMSVPKIENFGDQKLEIFGPQNWKFVGPKMAQIREKLSPDLRSIIGIISPGIMSIISGFSS